MSAVALVLLIGSSTTWAFSPIGRPFAVRPAYSRTVPAVSSAPHPRMTSNTWLRASKGISAKAAGIAEAKVCLTEIESSVQTARAYLKYLEDVAQVVLAHVEGTEAPQVDTSGRPSLPELGDASVAKDYLSNILTAYSAAEDYLNYLEGVAANVREYLNDYQSTNPAEQAQETKTRNILADLEETALAAQDYLVYLKGVADAVEQYLADPSQQPPPELASLPQANGTPVPSDLSQTPSSTSVSATATSSGGFATPAPAAAAYQPPPASSPAPATSYIDKLASTENAPPEKTLASTPPAKSGPSSTTIASDRGYLDSISSKTSAVKGSGPTGYLDSIQSSPTTTSGSRVPYNTGSNWKTTTSGGKAPSGYLSSLDTSPQGTRKKPTYTASSSVSEMDDIDDQMASASVFWSLVFVALATFAYWLNTGPEPLPGLEFRGINSAVERIQALPKTIEEMMPTPPTLPELDFFEPPPVVPEPEAKEEPAPVVPATPAPKSEVKVIEPTAPVEPPPKPEVKVEPVAPKPEAKVEPAAPSMTVIKIQATPKPEAKVQAPAPPKPEAKVVPAPKPEAKATPAPVVPPKPVAPAKPEKEPFADFDDWEF